MDSTDRATMLFFGWVAVAVGTGMLFGEGVGPLVFGGAMLLHSYLSKSED